jgi:copper chaperone
MSRRAESCVADEVYARDRETLYSAEPIVVSEFDRSILIMAITQETVLSVPDISCEHCVKTINGALGALPGIELVKTDIPTRTVQLRYDPAQVSMEQIEATLDDEGYSVAK